MVSREGFEPSALHPLMVYGLPVAYREVKRTSDRGSNPDLGLLRPRAAYYTTTLRPPSEADACPCLAPQSIGSLRQSTDSQKRAPGGSCTRKPQVLNLVHMLFWY